MPAQDLSVCRDMLGLRIPHTAPGGELRERLSSLRKIPIRQAIELIAHYSPADQAQLIAALLDESFELRHKSPQGATDLALLAAASARRYPGEPSLRSQLWGGALALFGNCARWTNREPAASRAWAAARRLTASTNGPNHLAALLSYFRGAYFTHFRHFDQAFSHLRQAAETYSALGERHTATAVYLTVANSYDTLGDTERALTELDKALALHEGGRDPVLSLSLYHALVSFLADLGEVEFAIGLFLSYEWMYEELGEDLLRLRGLWLKGRLFLRNGQPEHAIPVFTGVKNAFEARHLSYDAALAGLDLALALARCERHEEVQRLAEEMVPLFASHGIEREARMALDRWVEASRQRQTDADTVAQLIEELKEIGRRPLDLPAPKA